MKGFKRQHVVDFLIERRESIHRAKTIYGNDDFHHIVVDPGDDIICDTCNEEIEGDYVNIVEREARAYCEGCLKKFHPKFYRLVQVDNARA